MVESGFISIKEDKIIILDEVLRPIEMEFLISECSNFSLSEDPSRHNFYQRKWITSKKSKLSYFLKRSQEEFKNIVYDENYSLKILDIWINKVEAGDNSKEDYHIDDSEFTSITFLNDNFEGGNLQISKYGDKKIIEPKKGKTVFFKGSALPHKVLNVNNGARYTMVTFWEKENKKNLTLL
jgi:hypothetical protein